MNIKYFRNIESNEKSFKELLESQNDPNASLPPGDRAALEKFSELTARLRKPRSVANYQIEEATKAIQRLTDTFVGGQRIQDIMADMQAAISFPSYGIAGQNIADLMKGPGIASLVGVSDELAKKKEAILSHLGEIEKKAKSHLRFEPYDVKMSPPISPKFTRPNFASEMVEWIIKDVDAREKELEFGKQLLIFLVVGPDKIQVSKKSFRAIDTIMLEIKGLDGTIVVLSYELIVLSFTKSDLPSINNGTIH